MTPAATAARPLAYYHGEDAWGIERAVARLAVALGGDGERLEVWHTSGEESAAAALAPSTTTTENRRTRTLDAIEQRVTTAPFFGGGTLVWVRQPHGLLRDKASKQRLLGLIDLLAPGNALVFTELTDSTARTTGKATDPLRQAVEGAGGETREFPPLTRDRMERWLDERARELEVQLGAGAARLLAERVGAYVREGDVDRRGQTQLANAELEKLALYRPNGSISRDDVAELVAEAVPGSAWAFLDAIGARRAGPAAELATRLLDAATPLPVLVAQIHRRLRELLQVREHLAAGTRPNALPRAMGLKPFRAEKLAEQAAAWSLGDLERAVSGLLEVDLASKGIGLDGTQRPISDERSALGLEVWLAECVRRGAD
jgi:DNA polymerase-3 subunit delta